MLRGFHGLELNRIGWCSGVVSRPTRGGQIQIQIQPAKGWLLQDLASFDACMALVSRIGRNLTTAAAKLQPDALKLILIG